MKLYTVTYDCNTPTVQRLNIPTNTDYKVGVKIVKNGEVLDIDPEDMTLGATTADAEKLNGYVTFTKSTGAEANYWQGVLAIDADDLKTTFKLIINVYNSQMGDIGGGGSGGVTEQWVEDYVSAQTSAFVTDTELGTVLEAYPTTSAMNTAISTATSSFVTSSAMNTAISSATSDKVTGTGVGQAPAVSAIAAVYVTPWATLSANADANTVYVVLPDPVLPTRVKYTDASGLPDWEGDIVGELSSGSIPNKSYIAEVEIGSHVTSLGAFAFQYCSGLTSVTIPNSVTSIGNYVFYGCSGLTSVSIPNSVTSIGEDAFHDCRGLTSVEIPNSVTSIGYQAFLGCSGLTSITIPNSVTSIGNFAFEDCSSLASVTFSDKDKATVQGMSNYSWVLPSGCTIHCTDGDITIS